MAKLKPTGGRPRVVSDSVVTHSLELIAGGASLRRAARKLKVSVGALFDGLTAPAVAERYARARQERAHHIAEEAIAIADRSGKGADVNRDRLRVDTRKWYSARLDPARWGDRQHLDHSGGIATSEQQEPSPLEVWRRLCFKAACIAKEHGLKPLGRPADPDFDRRVLSILCNPLLNPHFADSMLETVQAMQTKKGATDAQDQYIP